MIAKLVRITLLLVTVAPFLHAKRELRVNIYPWLPDLADDGLQTLMSFIETTFEMANPEIDLQVSKPTLDIYNIDDLKTILSNQPTSPHVIEIDSLLLGEMVDEDLVKQIDPETYGLNTPGAYLPFTLEAAQYNGNYYAVPTLICGSYLMGINVGDITETCPIQDGVAAYTDLNVVLNQCKQDLMFPPRIYTVTGNFKGSWTLPTAYIDAYIDRYGPGAVYDAISSDIAAQSEVIADMKSFIEYCETEDGSNPCYAGTFADISQMVSTIVNKRQTITGYSYSEFIGKYLQQAINLNIIVNVYNDIAPPLGPQNNFLMYTDATVINKALVTDTQTQEDVDAFINFYSGLPIRLAIALGVDLPEPHPKRYLLQARTGFYSEPPVTEDEIYSRLSTALQYAVAAPNHGLYYNRNQMNYNIQQALGITAQCDSNDVDCKQ